MKFRQLRLFPAPQPLVSRFGIEFFRRIPSRPGVYVMSGEEQQILYVGQSVNLRDRLNSYRYIQLDRSPRRLVRLIHRVRCIAWELCETAQHAQLRENELLGIHKPPFNVANVRPELHLFVGVKLSHGELSIRLVKTPRASDREHFYGAFKGVARLRQAGAALIRLFFAADRQVRSPQDYPAFYLREQLAHQAAVQLKCLECGTEAEGWNQYIDRFFSGASDCLLDQLAGQLPAPETDSLFEQAMHAADLQLLREFYAAGPLRNRSIANRLSISGGLIEQSDLNDGLVIVGHKAAGQNRKKDAAIGCNADAHALWAQSRCEFGRTGLSP